MAASTRAKISQSPASAPAAAAPTVGEEIQLSVPWGNVAALAYGPADGKPVLGIHGWLDNAHTYNGLVPYLPKDVRFVAIDLPGHGFSSHKPPGVFYTMFNWVQDIEYVRIALGWKEFSLVGHSMGAAISLLYTGAFPEHVCKVMLIEGIVPLQDTESKARDNLKTAITKHMAIDGKRERVEPSMEAAETKLLASNTGLTPESAHVLMRRGAIASHGGYKFTRDVRVRTPTPVRMTEGMVTSFIQHINCDVMFIVATEGLKSAVTDRETRQVNELRNRARSLDIVELPGTHHLHLNDPHVVAPHFQRFLEMEASPAKAKLEASPAKAKL